MTRSGPQCGINWLPVEVPPLPPTVVSLFVVRWRAQVYEAWNCSPRPNRLRKLDCRLLYKLEASVWICIKPFEAIPWIGTRCWMFARVLVVMPRIGFDADAICAWL